MDHQQHWLRRKMKEAVNIHNTKPALTQYIRLELPSLCHMILVMWHEDSKTAKLLKSVGHGEIPEVKFSYLVW